MATQIVSAMKVNKINDNFFQVESSSRNRNYTVNPKNRTCTCPDALYRGHKDCKHLRAVEELIAAEQPATTKSAAEYQAEANEMFARRQAEQAIAAQNQRYEAAQEAARHELPSLVRDVPLTLEEAKQEIAQEKATALETAAAKAHSLTDEQLLFCAARHAGTPAGTACLTEIANRLTEARMVAARPAIGTSVKVWGPATDGEAWASLKGQASA